MCALDERFERLAEQPLAGMHRRRDSMRSAQFALRQSAFTRAVSAFVSFIQLRL